MIQIVLTSQRCSQVEMCMLTPVTPTLNSQKGYRGRRNDFRSQLSIRAGRRAVPSICEIYDRVNERVFLVLHLQISSPIEA